MRINGGFQVSKIKQLGDRIFEKILAAGVYISVKDTLAVDSIGLTRYEKNLFKDV